MFGKVVGGILGTVAFSVACIVGLLAGNDMTTVLSRALIAMLIFFAFGFVLGLMGRKLVDEHMKRIVDADRESQMARMEQPHDGQEGQQPPRPEPNGSQEADAA